MKIVNGMLALLIACCAQSSIAQKLKTEVVNYSYNLPPSVPIKGITNYQVKFEPAYEARNQQLIKEYQEPLQAARDKYRTESAEYPKLLKAANDRYDKELAVYNKKSLGKKLTEGALLNSGKPVREVIPRPYITEVAKPVLQSSYDYGMIADTYVQLQGYEKNPANALKILVLMYGYDHTVPRTMDQQTDNLSIGGSTGTRTYKATLYHTEFSYRHPMAVKVFTPDGKEVLSLTPPELNSYKVYKSAETDQPKRINTELLIKTNEEKVLQDNLKFLNTLLNDKFAFSKVSRAATLYYIKNGDNGYTDLTTAFNEASAGLLTLQTDAANARTKLQKAADIWNTALKESDLLNKKARINKDITLGIYFDLLEVYLALGDVINGQASLDKINSMSLSNDDRRNKLQFDMLFAELKNRQQHN
ncbi:hypothetical protein GCM10023149_10310 [Mucilaginibacter gynuensis]|uniref:Uncharacterized protein n=1 Tax=Mucilaginibacter gynuensis TaxID=1302236 RepID=A0ABP8FZT4_9SPHI